MSEVQGRKPMAKPARGFGALARAHLVTAAAWFLVASIFLLDVLTPAENVSIGFAYVVPVFLSLFELKPRPAWYAGTTTVLSLLGLLVQPESDLSTPVVVAHRLIAIATQWLAAALVGMSQRRHLDVQDKAELQRRFVDILSHEIGTALTTITGQAYRVAKLSEQLAPADLRVRADKIRKAAERIEAMIERVQLASSLGDGTIPIGRRPIDLKAMIRDLIEQLKEERRGRSIELDLAPEAQIIRGDEMLLRQMLDNIVSNSIKYSPGDARISINATKHGSMCRIAIADRGPGIARHELASVRRAYYRGDSSKGTSGVGLGLYFVERIVEAHKGRLRVESEIGKGTTVVVDLPQ